MLRSIFRALVLLVWVIACCGASNAQSAKSITIKVLDGHTGEHITPNNIEVRFNRQKTSHIDMVKLNDDGTTEVKIPDGTESISIHATYENSMDYYINCDVSKQKDTATDTWFPVADVLSQGIVMSNDCATKKELGNVKVEAKPGEFILFVRKRGWKEQWTQP